MSNIAHLWPPSYTVQVKKWPAVGDRKGKAGKSETGTAVADEYDKPRLI